MLRKLNVETCLCILVVALAIVGNAAIERYEARPVDHRQLDASIGIHCPDNWYGADGSRLHELKDYATQCGAASLTTIIASEEYHGSPAR